MPVTADEILNQYKDAVGAAGVAYDSATERLNAIQARLDAIPTEDILDGTGPRGAEAAALQKQIANLQKTYETAQQEYTQILHQRADAVTKAKGDADPAKQASLEAQAKADIAKANQIDAESKEYIATTPERRAAAKDASRLGKAKADEAEYALAVEKETDPVKKAAAQAALDRARADTARVVAETAQVGKAPPQTPEQQRAAAAGATVAEAGAATAAPTAAANLTALEANAATAQATLADAQRRLAQAPTDAQAQQRIQQEIDTAQTARDTAQQALEQAKALAPGAVAQQGATLAATQAQTGASTAAAAASQATIDKGKQGDLYGLQDKIKQIRDLIASGEIKPDQGDQMISAAQRGTNVYDVMKQSAADASTARGQDTQNKDALASAFGSTFNNSLTQFGEMNKTGAVGSDATGKAFLATLGLAQDYLKSYQMPAATPTDYLGTGPAPSPVGGMVNAAQSALAAAPPPPVVPPPPPPDAGGAPHVQPITINIGGGGQAGGGTLPAGYAGTQNDPRYGQTPGAFGAGVGNLYSGATPPSPALNGGDALARAASTGTMATKGEVLQTLFPRHAAALGLT